MASYDLLNEPWIPCIMPSGEIEYKGIRDTLLHAHEIREVYDDSPLITVALHRLLLAILYRSWDFRKTREWREWWTATWPLGAFPDRPINSYLTRWGNRFDLFDETHPFYQTAGLTAGPVPLSRIALHMTSGNNPTLFDHAFDSGSRLHSPAFCARLLVAAQCFNLGGLLKMRATLGDQEFSWPREENSILMPGAAVWLSGKTLFQTLMFGVVPVNRADDDLPSWELSTPASLRNLPPNGVVPLHPARGVADRYTWQSRLIRLRPERNGDGVGVRLADYTFGRAADTSREDPMLGYRASEKSGWTFFRLGEDKAAWRDAHTLLIDHEGVSQMPEIVRSAAETALRSPFPYPSPTLHIAGLASYQAKVYLWRHDRLPLPAALLANDQAAINAKGRLESLLREAEAVSWKDGDRWCHGMARQLQDATKRVIEYFLKPDKDDPNALPPNPKDVSSLLDAINPQRAYWARLEQHFHELVHSLSNDLDSASETWRNAIESEARTAFAEACRALGTSALAIQAVARVSATFRVPSRRSSNPPMAKETTAL